MPGLLPASPPPLPVTTLQMQGALWLTPSCFLQFATTGFPRFTRTQIIPGSSHDHEPDALIGPSPFPLNISRSHVLILKSLLSSAVSRQLGEALLPLTSLCLLIQVSVSSASLTVYTQQALLPFQGKTQQLRGC